MEDGLGSQWRSAPPYWLMGHFFFSEHRRDRIAARAALISSALIVVTLVIFFIWVFPANQATSNLTMIPDSWAELRRHWEYGHAANALILFAALLATGRALISRENADAHRPASRGVK